MTNKPTYEEVTQTLFEIVMETPEFKAEYDRYVEGLLIWIQNEINSGGRPVELQFALEYVAAVCEGTMWDCRVNFPSSRK